MDYISFKNIPYYSDCSSLVEGLGFRLIELKITPAKKVTKILAVIAHSDLNKNISVSDCSKVHHALLPRLEALLGTDNTSMELTSPGIDRNIKNAAEFELFCGRKVRVWSKAVNDWIIGNIKSSDEKCLTLFSDEKNIVIPFDEIAKAKFAI